MSPYDKEKDIESDISDSEPPSYDQLEPLANAIGFNPAYASQGQVMFMLDKHVWREDETGYEIKAQDGSLIAVYKGEYHCWRKSQHGILDASGKQVFELAHTLKTVWGAVVGRDAETGKELFKVSRGTSMRHSKVDITYTNPSTQKDEKLYLRGHFKSGRSLIRVGDAKNGRVVAQTQKDGTSSRRYQISAEPGFDLVFLAAICIAVDEVMNDTNQTGYTAPAPVVITS